MLDMAKKLKFKNTYFLLRHGESSINLRGLASGWPEKVYSPLTKKGVKQIKRVTQELKRKKIDLIFSSDLLRTKQTAKICAKALGLKIKFDPRLREINAGIFNGKPIDEIGQFWLPEGRKIPSLKYYQRRFKISPPQGENYADVEKRTSNFLKAIEKKYQGKNVLIVGHKRPFTLLEKIVFGWSQKKFIEAIIQNKEIKKSELRELPQ